MEYQTTEQWAETIAESWLNGQKKQAVEQFNQALNEECGSIALLYSVEDILPSEDFSELAKKLVRRYAGQ